MTPEAPGPDIQFVKGSPHVHVHFVTDGSTWNLKRDAAAEIVCHGCGRAVLVRYDVLTVRQFLRPDGSCPPLMALLEKFAADHTGCRAGPYANLCRPDRTGTIVVHLAEVVFPHERIDR